ncbi:MAG: type II secretion system F family protein [Candidatus Diapherotrites archaeon]
MMQEVWYRLARTLPTKWQSWAEKRVRQSGLKIEPLVWLAHSVIWVFIGSVGMGIVFYFVSPWIGSWFSSIIPSFFLSPAWWGVIGFILGIVFSVAVRWLRLYYVIENRRRKVEEILPDFLLLVAGNIRAGMTSFSAFKSSLRPEFGALSDEVRHVTSRSLGTGSFTTALMQVSENVESQSLSESVRFFVQASRSGGKVAQLLENTSNDLRRTQDLKKELESSTRTYIIFVAFVMVIATPLLMAVSVAFVELITRIQSQSSIGGAAGGLGFLGGMLTITPAFLEGMALILLIGNSILAGFFMGTIGKNKPLLGLRFSPIMFAVSVIVFWLAQGMLAGLLGVR